MNILSSRYLRAKSGLRGGVCLVANLKYPVPVSEHRARVRGKMSRRVCKWYAVCPMKFYHEHGKLDKRWLDKYCMGDWKSCVRYQMEERGEPHPDYMLPNGEVKEELAQ